MKQAFDDLLAKGKSVLALDHAGHMPGEIKALIESVAISRNGATVTVGASIPSAMLTDMLQLLQPGGGAHTPRTPFPLLSP